MVVGLDHSEDEEEQQYHDGHRGLGLALTQRAGADPWRQGDQCDH
jgi:hypothetical protein